MEQKQNEELDLLKRHISEDRLYDTITRMLVFKSDEIQTKIQTIDDLLNLKLDVIKKTADRLEIGLPIELKNFLHDESNESMILDSIQLVIDRCGQHCQV